jgi:hypothetical protein
VITNFDLDILAATVRGGNPMFEDVRVDGLRFGVSMKDQTGLARWCYVLAI